ncbi:MAG: hypothetical protein AB8B55_04555 [Mariniblastus sp.]
MRRCSYCGKEISPDCDDCPHCGKVLRKKSDDNKVGLTNINSWESKSVPSWVMYSLFAAIILVVILLIVKGCQGEPKTDPKSAPDKTTESNKTAELGIEPSPSIHRA